MTSLIAENMMIEEEEGFLEEEEEEEEEEDMEEEEVKIDIFQETSDNCFINKEIHLNLLTKMAKLRNLFKFLIMKL